MEKQISDYVVVSIEWEDEQSGGRWWDCFLSWRGLIVAKLVGWTDFEWIPTDQALTLIELIGDRTISDLDEKDYDPNFHTAF